MDLTYAALKERHREIRGGISTPVSLRIHRALSWLERAERESADDDARFIFLWIAFNSAYAEETCGDSGFTERDSQRKFFSLLDACDSGNLIHNTLWKEFPQAIRVLLDNPFVFPLFWDYQLGKISEAEWKNKFEASKKVIKKALGASDTPLVLSVLFERLYTLRNQIMHGAATWNSSVNRGQLRDGARILGRIVPAAIKVIMDNPDRDWGIPINPVVDDETGISLSPAQS